MATLYVDEQGVEIQRTGRRLVLQKDDVPIRTVRLRDVDSVVLFGPVDFTTPALHALLDAGIPAHFLSVAGTYRGCLLPAEGKNIPLRRAQFRRADDPDFCLHMARTILRAKISNCRYVLLRYNRNHPDPALVEAADRLRYFERKLNAQPDVRSCLGIEGSAARIYFAALGRMVPPEFAFSERSRRPPRDPVNALLSFGYTLLTSEIVGALAAHGLDPWLGLIHATVYGRPALALDILEEFRPVVIDRLALRLVNLRMLNPDHFETLPSGGVLLNEAGRARYLEQYHQVITQPVKSRYGDAIVSFRLLIRAQASRLRAAIAGEEPYDPYTPG